MPEQYNISFANEDQNNVSVWLLKPGVTQIPESYFECQYGEEFVDQPINQFAADFGFRNYDEDFAELQILDSPLPITELISPHSYGSPYFEAAAQAATANQITHSSGLFIIHNFEYDPAQTHKSQSDYFQFIGYFPFDPNS
ncbi:MAG: immunity 22 family protein [Fimbriimonadaceae bacterium]